VATQWLVDGINRGLWPVVQRAHHQQKCLRKLSLVGNRAVGSEATLGGGGGDNAQFKLQRQAQHDLEPFH